MLAARGRVRVPAAFGRPAEERCDPDARELLIAISSRAPGSRLSSAARSAAREHVRPAAIRFSAASAPPRAGAKRTPLREIVVAERRSGAGLDGVTAGTTSCW